MRLLKSLCQSLTSSRVLLHLAKDDLLAMVGLEGELVSLMIYRAIDGVGLGAMGV